jgi:ATP-dependent helicase/nuclease subunit B
MLDAGKAHCILYQQDAGDAAPVSKLLPQAPPADTPAAACLDAVFQSRAAPMPERARGLADTLPESPLAEWLTVFTASSPEQEARAIDLQVRQWLLDERNPIGIVTEDRRLARRVRALLERAGIELQDTGGWALSTTSAAAALERWLETIEEDFAHQPLLDVLKSPFSYPDDDPERFRTSVYRLEQDIIHHESIARGLERYRRHIDLRQQRLPDSWSDDTPAELQRLLNRLDQAADPLREVLGEGRAGPAELLQRLRDSLVELGMWGGFEADPAGQRILHEWQLLYDAAVHSNVGMCWAEFRAWLGAALERHDFRPATSNAPVMLLTIEQAQLGCFAGLVIGACDREHLPVKSPATPFFNDPVRKELGLPVWPQHAALQLSRFRRLLESAPDILMTWHREANGEPRMPSPWLDALQTFHQLGWQHDLEHQTLSQLINSLDTQVRGHNPAPAPVPQGYPSPVLPGSLLPASLSVSAHGDLIDCPYRFFSAHGLGLKPKEAVVEALQKSGYGEKVHRCLEIFHGGVDTWHEPFNGPVSGMNREAAIAALEKISRHVFTRDLEDNFEHRAWLRRWTALIPEYINWQIQHQEHWNVSRTEQRAELQLDEQHTLKGRLDRIDTGHPGEAIIDYKTGTPPKQAEVDDGEKVQLPSYALLGDNFPERVEYLKLDNQVISGASLEGEALAELAHAVKQRLVDVLQAIDTGTPLPAWGDAGTCRYCEMDALCRQQAWLDPEESTGQGSPDA